MLYQYILRPILFCFDAELIHRLFVNVGRCLGSNFLTRNLIGLFYNYHGQDISKTVDGIKYRLPIMLAAGFDYNGELTKILPYVSLGGEEIGSITARLCRGNSKPRLTRLKKSKSILVNKGLRNDGVEALIARLKKKSRIKDFVLGISIAYTNDAESVTLEKGIEDYCYSFKRLNEENIGDYYTINISCPNVFGGEAFTHPDSLEKLLTAIKQISCTKPIYIKMPINLSWQNFDQLLEIIDRLKINGLVIGNLNKNYQALDFRYEAPEKYAGGLSGKPCQDLSTDLIRRTREKYGRRFTIIGVGGIMSIESAKQKLDAGADLLQLITGMIYQGPGLMKKIAKSGII